MPGAGRAAETFQMEELSLGAHHKIIPGEGVLAC
jgi:hypothetical protein